MPAADMTKKHSFPFFYYPIWILLKALAALPLSVLYVLSDFLYVVTYYIIKYRKKVVLQNLHNAFPDKSEQEIAQIAKAFYKQFADVIVEILKLGNISASELRKRVAFENPEVVEALIAEGKPVIMLGSHVCNWEWPLSAGAVSFDFPSDGVYKELKNPFFEEYMLHIRSRLGGRLVKTTDSSRDFIRKRHQPRMIALLSDQTPLWHEIEYWTTFLNQDTGFFVGAEKLHKSLGHAILFTDIKRTARGHYSLKFEPMTGEVKSPPESSGDFPLTEEFVQKLEAVIHRNPANYLWTHKRWKHTREAANRGV